jgi:hypothetical protein
MIPINLPQLLEIYTLVFLAAVSVVWIAYEIGRKRRVAYSLRCRIRCLLCGMEFEDCSPAMLIRCPQCSSLNERSKRTCFKNCH